MKPPLSVLSKTSFLDMAAAMDVMDDAIDDLAMSSRT